MNAAQENASLAPLLPQFFLERLMQQRNASAQTSAAYRDSFRLLLQFAQGHLREPPERLHLSDLEAALVLAFLNHLESERHNTIRSRNARLAAIRSFLHFAALQEPAALAGMQRILAIPRKRCDKPLLGFLSRPEVQAILEAPDGTGWCGQRDRILFATLYNTGARVSEIIRLRVTDVVWEGSAAVHIQGKGRKQRTVPLWRTTASQLRRWRTQIDSRPDRVLFPSRSGVFLTRSAVTARLQRAVQEAAVRCPSLKGRRVSPPHFVIPLPCICCRLAWTLLSLRSGWVTKTPVRHTYMEKRIWP